MRKTYRSTPRTSHDQDHQLYEGKSLRDLAKDKACRDVLASFLKVDVTSILGWTGKREIKDEIEAQERTAAILSGKKSSGATPSRIVFL
jgi:hypothetical protein